MTWTGTSLAFSLRANGSSDTMLGWCIALLALLVLAGLADRGAAKGAVLLVIVIAVAPAVLLVLYSQKETSHSQKIIVDK
jgi:hypothetical protein